jgi:hypothetical protein
MTHQHLVAYFESLGYTTETVAASNPPASYLIIRAFPVRTGSRTGQQLDVGIQESAAVPYVFPPALHVRPAVVPMGTAASQASPLGPDWQYLSRVLRVPPTPGSILTHIHSVLSEL